MSVAIASIAGDARMQHPICSSNESSNLLSICCMTICSLHKGHGACLCWCHSICTRSWVPWWSCTYWLVYWWFIELQRCCSWGHILWIFILAFHKLIRKTGTRVPYLVGSAPQTISMANVYSVAISSLCNSVCLIPSWSRVGTAILCLAIEPLWKWMASAHPLRVFFKLFMDRLCVCGQLSRLHCASSKDMTQFLFSSSSRVVALIDSRTQRQLFTLVLSAPSAVSSLPYCFCCAHVLLPQSDFALKAML